MAIVSVRELRDRATKILRQVEEGETTIVTRRGEPIAAITPFTRDDLEDWLLAHGEVFKRRIEAAMERMDRGRGIPLDELERRWGLEE